ncbi:MAG TPA: AarF/UbiB family protein [Mycobacteriales bacterium]|jgi:predicted unusual protein kinase regulating ubiquinone biosynthesis (AarF/ABC1/UbiB family)
MAVSLRPRHVKRYKDLGMLLVRYGRSDIVSGMGLDAGTADTDGMAASAADLAADLERLGPTYVKLGQLLSTRADLLPPPYTAALARLQDDVAPFGFDEVEDIVCAELGVRLSRVFPEFDREPLASASLGQVHRATLRDGRQVVVKVQRPGIRDTVLDDLDALRELAELADARTDLGRRYGFAGMVAEFRASMLAELDYLAEARNLVTLGENLRDFDRIHVPQPVTDLSTARVLTMEYVDGRKLTGLGPLAQLDVDGGPLARQLLAAYLQQILVDGFFHADPHPGNVLLTADGDLALLDLGMVGRIPAHLGDRLVKLLLAVSEGRAEEATAALLSLAERTGEADEAAFGRAIAAIVAENHGASLGALSAGAIVMELFRAAVANDLRPPPELSMLGRALLTLDDVARHLDPRMDPNAAIREQAVTIMRARMTSAASPGSLYASVLEAKEFAERFPGRVNKVMDALAEGELTLNVAGIEQREIIHGIQKLANRLTAGVVIAALIVGAAMLMRVQTTARILGYPAFAIVCFLMAAGFGLALLGSIVVGDRRTSRRHLGGKPGARR